jgi:hypothetical protein
MDIYEFEEFIKIVEWEVQKYTINQKMNGKEISSENIIDLIIKCENKAKKKYFKGENNERN